MQIARKPLLGVVHLQLLRAPKCVQTTDDSFNCFYQKNALFLRAAPNFLRRRFLRGFPRGFPLEIGFPRYLHAVFVNEGL